MIKIKELYQIFLSCNSVSIDTRKIEKNSMFFSIKGDHFDANTFANQALILGAKFVIIDNEQYYIDQRTILVKDGLSALQQLASYHRDQLKFPIIALTGSNGKTTSKELINAVLSKKFRVKATVGNLNNHIGVPLTLLTFNQSMEIGIVEMGANHQKEIEFLCSIAKPDYGYITNFGKAHLEGFGGVEGVIKGKCELYNFLVRNNKKVFVNLDDPLQVAKSVPLHQISFSQSNINATVLLTNASANPLAKVDFEGHSIQSNLIGFYNITNISVAITIGDYFGISATLIQQAIENYIPENNRSQLINKNSNKIILDAYNANPSSMLAALVNFHQLQNSNKIVILGDMFELGSESHAEHQLVVNYVIKNLNSIYFFIGKAFFYCRNVTNSDAFYESFEDFIMDFDFKTIHNSTILIKGSRGMALERILNYL